MAVGNFFYPIDSRFIFKLLQKLTNQKTNSKLYDLLLLSSNDGQSFAGMSNRVKRCWWQDDHVSFVFQFLKLQDKKKHLEYDLWLCDDQKFPLPNNDSLWCQYATELNQKIQDHKAEFTDPKFCETHTYIAADFDDQLTFSSHVFNVLNTAFKKTFSSENEKIKYIIDFSKNEKLLPSEISRIEKIKNFEEILVYIITRAEENKGSLLAIPISDGFVDEEEARKEWRILSAESAALASGLSDATKQTPGLATVSDLLAAGLTTKQVSAQLMANDKALYGEIGIHSGEVAQWATHMEQNASNWRFLCIGKEIVGNWSITFLPPSQERELIEGSLRGIDLTAVKADSLVSSDGEVLVHILNLSMNEGVHNSPENWLALWRSFGERLQELARDGYFYRGISSVIFRDDHRAEFEKLGFESLGENAFGGTTYFLDLTTREFPAAFSRIMPEEELSESYQNYWGVPMEFRQLSAHDFLTEMQSRDLARLVYMTDKHISHALFKDIEQAKRLLPIVFSGNRDVMFCLPNIYACFAGNRIIGIILWKRGALNWKKDQLEKVACILGEDLPSTLNQVEENYFSRYNIPAKDTIQIINVCVEPCWQSHTMRVCTSMMKAFIDAHRHEQMELYVLRETPSALEVYTRNGFDLHTMVNGFSLEERKLPCAFMVREPDRD